VEEEGRQDRSDHREEAPCRDLDENGPEGHQVGHCSSSSEGRVKSSSIKALVGA
jgi:hypothetical protein